MQNQDVEVFFDGQCPLCRREIDWLRRMDSQQRIAFTDISEPTFSPSAQGLSLSREAQIDRGGRPDWAKNHKRFFLRAKE